MNWLEQKVKKMNLSKKLHYTLLAFLVLLNVLLRYPTTSHEMGVDSFFIHNLANSISANGYAKWVVNPLSVFGLYPYSYPSAVPYILSGVSQSTGLNMELTIFLVAIFVGIFGMFSAYLMAKEIKNDDLFVFLVVFAFSTAPIFLSFTRWTTSTRHLFIAILPLFIWSLLRCHNEKSKKHLLLAAFLFGAMFSTHKIVWLIIPVFLAYFIATIIQKSGLKIKLSKEFLIPTLAILILGALIMWIVLFTDSILPLVLLIFVAYFLNSVIKKLDKKLRVPIVISLILLLLFTYAFIIQFSGFSIYKSSNIWYYYQTGYFFTGSEWYILVLNMLSNYTGQIGILIFFGIIGLFILLLKPKKDFNDWFILLGILFLVPLSALGMYLPLFLLPFFSVLIGLGLCKIINTRKIKKHIVPTIVCCLLLSLSFSGFMINNWNTLSDSDTGTTNILRDETYSAAVFLKEYGTGSFISNDKIIGYRISACSGVPIFSGGDTLSFVYGFTDNVEIIGLTKFTLNMDSLYVVNNTVQNDHNILLTLDCDNATAKEILSKYNIHYYIENNNMQPQNQFFKSIHEKKYKIYDDGVESIWYFGRGY